VTEADHENPED